MGKLYASIHHIWSANVGTHKFSNRKNKVYTKNNGKEFIGSEEKR